MAGDRILHYAESTIQAGQLLELGGKPDPDDVRHLSGIGSPAAAGGGGCDRPVHFNMATLLVLPALSGWFGRNGAGTGNSIS